MVTIELAVIVSVLSVVVSIVSVAAAIFFSSKNSKRTDAKDIEERVRENTRINMKLDGIAESIRGLKEDLVDVKNEIQQHNDKIIRLDDSVKSAHRRIDEFVEKCKVCGGKCRE